MEDLRSSRSQLKSSPTLHADSFTVALAIAAHKNWNFRTMDVSNAFLYDNLPDGIELYCEIPDGHELQSKNDQFCMKISKNLYGLKEGPHLWHRHVRNVLCSKLCLTQCVFEECMFFKENLIALLYVDDIMLLGTTTAIDQTICKFKKEFKITVGKLK